MKINQTDGGKIQEGFTNEYNDCGVRAFALACDITYARAHELLKAEGRRDQKGTKMKQLEAAMHAADIKFEQIVIGVLINQFYRTRAYPTLADVIRKYTTGRYIVITNRHGMALIDGVIHDSGQISGPRSRIKVLYRITTDKPAVTQSQVNELWERLNQLEAR